MPEQLTLVVLLSAGAPFPADVGRGVAVGLEGKSAVIPAEDVMERWITTPDDNRDAERIVSANLLKLNAVTLLKNGYHVVVEAVAGTVDQTIDDLVRLAGTFGVRTTQVQLVEDGVPAGAPSSTRMLVPLSGGPRDAARRVLDHVRRW